MLDKENLLCKIDSMDPEELLGIMAKAFDAAGIRYENKPGQITFTGSGEWTSGHEYEGQLEIRLCGVEWTYCDERCGECDRARAYTTCSTQTGEHRE